MFSNLSKGNILYGLDKSNGEIKYFTAVVENATPTLPVNVGQFMGNVMNIEATRDGKVLKFQQIPSSSAIADYGNNTFVLADSKDSLTNYVNSKLQASRNIVNSYEENKKLVESYTNILNDINPNPNSDELKAIKDEFSDIKDQFKEIISLLKGNTNKE